MVSNEAVLVTDLKPDVIEDPATVRTWLPPRWCDDCEAGCSFDRCWWCAGRTRPLRREFERRMVKVAGSQSVMTWQPEAEPEP